MATFRKRLEKGTTLYPVKCKWCGNTDWVENPRQQFCADKNHRIYWSKARTKAMQRLWKQWLHERISSAISWEDCLDSFDRDTVEYLANRLGMYYDDEKREYVRAN